MRWHFFPATILIPFQIINFICLQKWIYKSVQTTEEKLEQIDRGNKTLAEFEVEIANTPFLMDIFPLIKHYLSLKTTEITPRFLPSRQN